MISLNSIMSSSTAVSENVYPLLYSLSPHVSSDLVIVDKRISGEERTRAEAMDERESGSESAPAAVAGDAASSVVLLSDHDRRNVQLTTGYIITSGLVKALPASSTADDSVVLVVAATQSSTRPLYLCSTTCSSLGLSSNTQNTTNSSNTTNCSNSGGIAHVHPTGTNQTINSSNDISSNCGHACFSPQQDTPVVWPVPFARSEKCPLSSTLVASSCLRQPISSCTEATTTTTGLRVSLSASRGSFVGDAGESPYGAPPIRKPPQKQNTLNSGISQQLFNANNFRNGNFHYGNSVNIGSARPSFSSQGNPLLRNTNNNRVYPEIGRKWAASNSSSGMGDPPPPTSKKPPSFTELALGVAHSSGVSRSGSTDPPDVSHPRNTLSTAVKPEVGDLERNSPDTETFQQHARSESAPKFRVSAADECSTHSTSSTLSPPSSSPLTVHADDVDDVEMAATTSESSPWGEGPVKTAGAPEQETEKLQVQQQEVGNVDTGRRLRLRNLSRTFLPEKTRHKRQTLQDMTRPLKLWLVKHRDHPYPSKSEKIELVKVSRMTMTQVSNWFANARRRLKNTVRGDNFTWAKRIKAYNKFAEGNVELLSVPSSDEDWDSHDDDIGNGEAHDVSDQASIDRQPDPPRAPTLATSLSDPGLTSPTTTPMPMTSPTTRSSPSIDDSHGGYPKYKHSILQRYLQDASQQTMVPVDVMMTSRSRDRHLSSSTGSHDFEYLSTSSVSSPSHEAHHDSMDEFSEDMETIAIRRRSSEKSPMNDDMYWKEIGAALALTSLARSHVTK